jgi:2'-5' RNA ligase
VPHITLARLKRSAGPIGGLLERSGGLTSPPFTVTEFGLYESDLMPDGSVYSLIERYRID